MNTDYQFCPRCAKPLANLSREEDGGMKARLRCADDACGFVHWNNPTPVLAAVVEYRGQVLLARNAAWTGRMFALITGFMEAGESPEEGLAREVKEETNLDVKALKLIGVYDFQRMNQVIVAYHALADDAGEIRLSPELAEYKLLDLERIVCWPSGTGFALAAWLRTKGVEPAFMEWPKPKVANE
jgi:NAD+ diphosphatase